MRPSCLHETRRQGAFSMRIAVEKNTRFDRLMVVREVAPNRWGHRRFLCVCDCGTKKAVGLNELRNGRTRSCGCLHDDVSSVRMNKLNSGRGRKHPLYRVWKGMIVRCSNSNCAAYKRYGGRGIRVCNEWKNDSLAFINWGIANGWSPHLTIERIDNDGNYQPSNCEFITKSENTNRRLQRERTHMRAAYVLSALSLSA